MKGNKGITLIALVITIVVMLIISGIMINLTISENGIFKRATSSKEEHEKGVIQEYLAMEWVMIEAANDNYDVAAAQFEAVLKETDSNAYVIAGEDGYVTVGYKGFVSKINKETGKIIVIGNSEREEAKNTIESTWGEVLTENPSGTDAQKAESLETKLKQTDPIATANLGTSNINIEVVYKGVSTMLNISTGVASPANEELETLNVAKNILITEATKDMNLYPGSNMAGRAERMREIFLVKDPNASVTANGETTVTVVFKGISGVISFNETPRIESIDFNQEQQSEGSVFSLGDYDVVDRNDIYEHYAYGDVGAINSESNYVFSTQLLVDDNNEVITGNPTGSIDGQGFDSYVYNEEADTNGNSHRNGVMFLSSNTDYGSIYRYNNDIIKLCNGNDIRPRNYPNDAALQQAITDGGGISLFYYSRRNFYQGRISDSWGSLDGSYSDNTETFNIKPVYLKIPSEVIFSLEDETQIEETITSVTSVRYDVYNIKCIELPETVEFVSLYTEPRIGQCDLEYVVFTGDGSRITPETGLEDGWLPDTVKKIYIPSGSRATYEALLADQYVWEYNEEIDDWEPVAPLSSKLEEY